MSRKFLMCVLAALMVVACGGGGGEADTSTTVGSDEETPTTAATTPEAPATTTGGDDGGGQTVDIGDIPQECIDAFVEYLRAIEPTVEAVDWETASMDQWEEIANELDAVTTEYEAATADSGCEDIEVDATAEESFEFLLAIAEDEAPGTVGYLGMIGEMAEGFEDLGTGASGDCEADIAAIEAMIAQYDSMEDMSIADITAVGTLMTSVTANCSPERTAEFFEREDVSSFLGG